MKTRMGKEESWTFSGGDTISSSQKRTQRISVDKIVGGEGI